MCTLDSTIYTTTIPWPHMPTRVATRGCSNRLESVDLPSSVNVDDLERTLLELKSNNEAARRMRFVPPDRPTLVSTHVDRPLAAPTLALDLDRADSTELGAFVDANESDRVRQATAAAAAANVSFTVESLAPRYRPLLEQHLRSHAHERLLWVYNVPRWHLWRPMLSYYAIMNLCFMPLGVLLGFVYPLFLVPLILFVVLVFEPLSALFVMTFNNSLAASFVLTDRAFLCFGTGNMSAHNEWNNLTVLKLNDPPQSEADFFRWQHSFVLSDPMNAGYLYVSPHLAVEVKNARAVVSYILQCWLQCVRDNHPTSN